MITSTTSPLHSIIMHGSRGTTSCSRRRRRRRRRRRCFHLPLTNNLATKKHLNNELRQKSFSRSTSKATQARNTHSPDLMMIIAGKRKPFWTPPYSSAPSLSSSSSVSSKQHEQKRIWWQECMQVMPKEKMNCMHSLHSHSKKKKSFPKTQPQNKKKRTEKKNTRLKEKKTTACKKLVFPCFRMKKKECQEERIRNNENNECQEWVGECASYMMHTKSKRVEGRNREKDFAATTRMILQRMRKVFAVWHSSSIIERAFVRLLLLLLLAPRNFLSLCARTIISKP